MLHESLDVNVKWLVRQRNAIASYIFAPGAPTIKLWKRVACLSAAITAILTHGILTQLILYRFNVMINVTWSVKLLTFHERWNAIGDFFVFLFRALIFLRHYLSLRTCSWCCTFSKMFLNAATSQVAPSSCLWTASTNLPHSTIVLTHFACITQVILLLSMVKPAFLT